MTTLEEWDPRPCIIRWLHLKDLIQKDIDKSKKQIWFKGIFNEAQSLMDIEIDDEDNQPQRAKAKKF